MHTIQEVTWEDKVTTALLEARRITRAAKQENDMARREVRNFFHLTAQEEYGGLRFDDVEMPEDDMSCFMNRARADWADNPIL